MAGKAAYDRDAEILARYRDGESTVQLGRAYGLSRQRVHQIVARHGGPRRTRGRELNQAAVEERQRRREQVRTRFLELVNRRPPMTLQQAADRLRLRDTELAQLLRPGDRRLLLPPERLREQRYTDDELADAVRSVARQLGVDLLTREAYDEARARSTGLPSSARITQRFGTWTAACRNSGLRVRAGRSGPARRWTRAQMLAAVAEYLDDPGRAGTSWEYEVWRVGRDAPGYPALRQEFGSWHTLKSEALRLRRKSSRSSRSSRS